MEKVENQNNTSINQNQDSGEDSEKTDKNFDTKNKHETDKVPKEDIKEYTPEEKIAELEEAARSCLGSFAAAVAEVEVVACQD